MFRCLNANLKLLSTFIIKNRMMKRVRNTKQILFRDLSKNDKIFLTLNC